MKHIESTLFRRLLHRFCCLNYRQVIAFFVLFFHAGGAAFGASGKNVCTITINSDDEKNVFQRYLPSQGFKFTELTDYGKTEKGKSQDWFKTACASQVQCDVLIISGHFGGTFFGSSHLNLSFNDLQDASCSNRCGGILSKPTEVFLFGCNTLASHGKDLRTPDEYLTALLQDGMQRAMAERVVESRYGQLGLSNQAQMRQIFNSVPVIYGFSSKAPLGVHVKDLLGHYLAQIPDYSAHLTEIKKHIPTSLSELQVLEGDTFYSQVNPRLHSTLLKTSLTASPGIIGQSQIGGIREDVCEIRNDVISTKSKLETIYKGLNGSHFLEYIPAIGDFFKKRPPSQYSHEDSNLFQQIQFLTQAKSTVLTYFENIKTPILKYEIANLARVLGWLSPAQYEDYLKGFFQSYLKSPVRFTDLDILCSVPDTGYTNFTLKSSDLDNAIYEDSTGLQGLSCLKMKLDTNIQLKLLEVAFDAKWATPNARDLLFKNKVTDPMVIKAITHEFFHQSDWVRHMSAYDSIHGLFKKNPLILRQFLEDIINESKSNAEAGADYLVSYVEEPIEIQDPPLLQSALSLTRSFHEKLREAGFRILAGASNGSSSIKMAFYLGVHDFVRDVRYQAIRSAFYAGLMDDGWKERLLGYLKDKDTNVRFIAVEALPFYKIDQNEVIRILLSELDDNTPSLKANVLDALAKMPIKEKSDFQRIARELHTKDGAYWALLALEHLRVTDPQILSEVKKIDPLYAPE